MALAIHNGIYPEKGFCFWRSDTPKINLINGEDFPIDDILRWLNVSSASQSLPFGNCDGNEARERLAVMKFLYENPSFISLAQELRYRCSVPKNEDNFRDFYDPARERNPFWTAYQKLVSFLEEKGIENLPARLRIFYDALISFKDLEADEKEMVGVIGKMLESNAMMEGAIVMPFSVGRNVFSNTNGSQVEVFYGHKTFSYGLSEARQKSLPKWLENKKSWKYRLFSWNWGKIIRRLISRYNEDMKNRALRSMVLTECPRQIKEDIASALVKILSSSGAEENANIASGLVKVIPPCTSLEAVIYFVYGKRYYQGQWRDGLTVRLLDIRYARGQIKDRTQYYFLGDNGFAGYSQERIKAIAGGQTRLREFCQEVALSLMNERLRHKITERCRKLKLFGQTGNDFFNIYHDVDSPHTDSAHKWQALENIYEQPEINPLHLAISKFYSFTAKVIGELVQMQMVLSQFAAKASEIGTAVCFPEILPEGKNVVDFSELYPLHLDLTIDGKKVHPIPIDNLPSLNGRMIGLTGRHGGGKTVVEHTIAGNVYLALSGLPVFGKKFRLNPKTHIGLVFVEGVKGRSVAQTLLDKTEKLFLGIRDVPQSRVVVIVDELGSNTQAEDGLVFGQRVLKTLATMPDTSVIFSTQILQLAKFAEAELGAKCFFVNKEHRLNSGIRGGEFSDLVDESKLKGILVK